VSKHGENPAKYLLALKYIEALKKISQESDTKVDFMPTRTANVLTAQTLGYNTLVSVQ